MTDQSPSRPMVQDQRSQGTHPGYMPGFGNDFETEALPDALPQGMNSPQKCNYGLYGEQLSGTAFTAPSHQNERTWCYRIRPVGQAFAALPEGRPALLEERAARGRGRDFAGPVPMGPGAHTDQPLTWLTGMRTMTTAGDVNTQVGMASHIYLVTASMEDEYFYSADSEILIVPQEGKLQVLHRARYHRPGAAGDRDHPARAPLPGGGAGRSRARLRLRELWPEIRASGPWADRRQLHGQPAGFQDARGGLRGPRGAVDGHREMVRPVPRNRDRAFPARRRGLARQLRAGEIRPQDLLPVGAILFDHPDPSIFTVLTAPSGVPGTANIDFVLFRERWMVAEDTFRPPWYHKNIMSELMGNIYGQYDAKPQGFVPGGMSLHNMMLPHGPDREAFEGASNADLAPHKLDNTMSFMFETRFPQHLTEFAAKEAPLQDDYIDCWTSLEKKFDGTPGKK
jgi:homogentisate 1,2-dioxygenase